jgi:hypothetical protein
MERLAKLGPPIELRPAPFTPNPGAAKVKSATAAKTAKPSSVAVKTAKPSAAQPGDQAGLAEEKVPSPTIMRPEVPASGQPAEKAKTIAAKMEAPASAQPAETSDSVLKKAKATIAAKMEDPASAEFDDMRRAIRKNTFGQPVDTICGHVKGKKGSGEDTGKRPFLYLVKEDEAYVVAGNAESAAAAAYRNICITLDLRVHQPGFSRKGFPPATEP